MTTPTQQRLKDAIQAALDSGGWERVPNAYSYTIRYSERNLPTPERMRKPGIYGSPAQWSGETYDRHVFLTVIGGQKWYLGVRVARAPWVGATDQTVTFKRAFEVLADPKAVFS